LGFGKYSSRQRNEELSCRKTNWSNNDSRWNDCYLQSLDIAVNKQFKDHLQVDINEYMENRMVRNQRENLVKPGLNDVVKWVKNSWDKITGECVANALRAGYLDKKYPFTETLIARHKTYGPMIKREMDLQEIQTKIENIMICDDIPED